MRLPNRSGRTEYRAWVLVLCCTLLFVAYLIPPIYTYFHREYYAYTNAWDEETYLSYQGALGMRNAPGYFFSSYCVLLMHELGISGGAQNFLLDLVVPIFVFLLAVGALSHYGVDKSRSLFCASILVFGSVFFNQSNPLVFWIVSKNLPHLTSALECYPSILRTPNPQLGYLLIALFGFLAVKKKALYLLLIPLPFLYWSLAIPYAFILFSLFLYRKLIPRSLYGYVLVNLAAGMVIGGITYLAFALVVAYRPGLAETRFASPFHSGLYSITFVASLIMYGVTLVASVLTRQPIGRKYHFVYITLITCLAFIANVQIFTQVRLDPKNLQDSAGTVIAASILCLSAFQLSGMLRSSMTKRTARVLGLIGNYGVLMAMLFLVLLTRGFEPRHMRYRIFLNHDIAQHDLDQIIRDPLHAIIPWDMTSARMSLIAPKILIPPFSYQYDFPMVNKLCSRNEELVRQAYEYVKNHVDENAALLQAFDHISGNVDDYFSAVIATQHIPYKDNEVVCNQDSYMNNRFFVVPLKDGGIWGFFPNW